LHTVLSGFSILDSASGNEITDVVCTKVKFQKFTPDLLEWYVSTGEPFGKAGAYSIQGYGLILIESISGSYNNVVGFPIENIIRYMLDNGWISYSEKNQEGINL
jgi:septum formation protein